MSLVSHYVEAVDGNLYKCPTLSGPGWFVCFDDDDPPEIVVQKTVVQKPWDILGQAKIPYRNVYGRGSSYRLFNGEFVECSSWWFDLTGPIPIPTAHDGVVDKSKIWQGVVYSFKKKAPRV